MSLPTRSIRGVHAAPKRRKARAKAQPVFDGTVRSDTQRLLQESFDDLAAPDGPGSELVASSYVEYIITQLPNFIVSEVSAPDADGTVEVTLKRGRKTKTFKIKTRSLR